MLNTAVPWAGGLRAPAQDLGDDTVPPHGRRSARLTKDQLCVPHTLGCRASCWAGRAQ